MSTNGLVGYAAAEIATTGALAPARRDSKSFLRSRFSSHGSEAGRAATSTSPRPTASSPRAPASGTSRRPATDRASYLIAKRTIDMAGAIVILMLVSPVLLTVLAILLVTTKGHPFFCQERLGFLGRPFRLYKFRTMVLDAEKLRALVKNEQDGPIFKNRADPRITRLGRILRRTSIDELPQLFNVLRGDMSLIGPRPPLAHEVDAVQALAAKAAGREARFDLPVASERPQRDRFRPVDADGLVVRQAPKPAHGYRAPAANAVGGPQRSRRPLRLDGALRLCAMTSPKRVPRR